MATRAASKLFVGNLPWTVGTRELRQYFSEFGHVASANVIFDKNTGFSRGYGFVVFSTTDGIQAAKARTDHALEGNLLNLRISSSQ